MNPSAEQLKAFKAACAEYRRENASVDDVYFALTGTTLTESEAHLGQEETKVAAVLFAQGFADGKGSVEARPRPKIICLCGSTRFIEQFAIKTWELELEGNIVLGCTLLPSWYCPVRDHFAEALGVKEQRDNQHLQKIDLADSVHVLNYEGYIGESTRNEIEYAKAHNKPITYEVLS